MNSSRTENEPYWRPLKLEIQRNKLQFIPKSSREHPKKKPKPKTQDSNNQYYRTITLHIKNESNNAEQQRQMQQKTEKYQKQKSPYNTH